MSSTPENMNLIGLGTVSVVRSGKPILDSVTWTVAAGEHWVVLGPNGAGKTTLAGILAGRTDVDAGDVTLLGSSADDHHAAELAARVGFASSEVGERLLPNETVLSVVLTAAWGQSVHFGEEYEDDDEQRGTFLLEALGMGALTHRPYGTLSEGEKRRVLIARALMADPELLVLDEPTAGLDLGGREILLQALNEIMTAPSSPNVILITHELEEIGPEFTHALLLQEGRVYQAGPIGEVLTGANLTEVFGVNLEVKQQHGRWWAFSADTAP